MEKRSRQQLPIKRLPNGRYRLWVDVALPGEPRKQRAFTFDTEKEAKAKYAEVRAGRDQGDASHMKAKTFRNYADDYLAKKAQTLRPVTVRGYASALKHPINAFGDRPINSIRFSDVEKMLHDMIDLRTGKARPLSKRQREMVLTVTAAVFDRALRDSVMRDNPARLVERSDLPGEEAVERQPISLEEMTAIKKTVDESEWRALWLFTLMGLRRSEVLGLTWDCIDLDQATVKVVGSRTSYGKRGDATIERPKSKRSKRTLPLSAEHVAALRRWQLKTGGDGFVAVDDDLRPVGPDEYSRAWAALVASAGIDRPILLHEARHAAVTYLREAGLPDRDIAAWMGHSVQMTRGVYDHHQGDFDEVAEALGNQLQGKEAGRRARLYVAPALQDKVSG